MKIYEKLLTLAKKRANYFCLLDPDKMEAKETARIAKVCEKNGADGILVGGSLMLKNNFEENLALIKQNVNIPVIIFPGIFNFVSPHADALLLLSVITSRKPQMLIGEHVRAAPLIKHYNLETIGTAYMVVESGNSTSVQFMSDSTPIPRKKYDIAVAHALAGQYLGMRILYMDAGSGAKKSIPDEMIKSVKQNISIPLIVGGGIKTPEEAQKKAIAGADFVVTGSVIEKNFNAKLIKEFAHIIHSVKRND